MQNSLFLALVIVRFAHVLSSSPAMVAPEIYFDFNLIPSSNTAKDLIHGRTLTWKNGDVTLAANSGQAIQNGNNVIAPISDTKSLTFTMDKSYAVFVEFSIRDVTSDYWFFLVGKMTNKRTQAYPRDMALWTNPKRKQLVMTIWPTTDAAQKQCQTHFSAPYVANQRYNMAFVYDAATKNAEFYVDGVAASKAPQTFVGEPLTSCEPITTQSVSDNSIYIGGDPSKFHNLDFPGTFYRVIVFNDKISQAQIKAIGSKSADWQRTLQQAIPTPQPTPKPTTKVTTRQPTAPLGGSIYKCCSDFASGSREAARKACQRGQDDLVTIFNDTENAVASSVCGTSQPCWIGLKADASGKWTWVNGASALYKKFAAGQPKLEDGACVVIDSQGQWKMASCAAVLPAVCEYPAGSFVAEAGVLPSSSVGVEPWLIGLMVGGLVLCCALFLVPCVLLGRMKQGELQPLLTKA